MSLNFNPDFPKDISSTLNSRASNVSNREKNWNYKKYAWVNISTTGKTKSIICTQKMSIGDGNIRSGGAASLYTSEGSVRKYKPTLNSVNISNNAAGGDYVDAYLYEVDASFKVFTLVDLELVEQSFFRIGAEMKVEFGWRNRTSDGDSGVVYANIYNFSYSIDSDGGYNCEVKAISPSALWQSDELGSTVPPIVNYFEDLENELKIAFGVEDSDDTLSAASSDDGAVSDIGEMSDVLQLERTYKPKFLYIVMDTAPFYSLFGDDTFIKYTTLGTLIRYINDKQLKLTIGGENPDFKYETTNAGEPGSDFPQLEEIGSADPTKFILPGIQSSYGKRFKDDDRQTNMASWPEKLTDDVDVSRIASIAVSIGYCNRVWNDAAESAETKGGLKQNPKISEFFTKIFEELEYLTGGLLSLGFVPTDSDGNLHTQLSDSTDTIIMKLINRKNVTNKSLFNKSTVYEFKTLGDDSILKSVSLESNFDSDYIMMASRKSLSANSSNYKAALGIFTCPEPIETLTTPNTESENDNTTGQRNINNFNNGPGLVKDVKLSFEKQIGDYSAGDIPAPPVEVKTSATNLRDIRHKYGQLGMDDFNITSYANACKNHILQNARTDRQLKENRYSEILFTLDLGVTIDGIWGIPLLSPIIIDRIPTSFKKKGVKFSVIAADHAFDGQGNWDTSLKTVMRII